MPYYIILQAGKEALHSQLDHSPPFSCFRFILAQSSKGLSVVVFPPSHARRPWHCASS